LSSLNCLINDFWRKKQKWPSFNALYHNTLEFPKDYKISKGGNFVTLRAEKLRKRLLDSEPTLSLERAIIATEAYQKFEAEPVPIKRAKVLKEVVSKMKIAILPDELIVGHQAGGLRNVAIFPEYSCDWLENEIDRFEKRKGDRFFISSQDKAKLKEILVYWKGKTLKERAINMIPKASLNALEAKIFVNPGDLNSGVGHIIVNYGEVISRGIKGILEDIKNEINQLDISVPEDFHKSIFLKAAEIICEAAMIFAERHAEKVEKMVIEEIDENRKIDLKRISEICRHVPANGARSFQEAIQSFWFIHLLMHIESNGFSISPGRFDQYMYPYLKRDLEKGNISYDEAQELLDCLWIKFNEVLKVRDEFTSLQAGGYPMYQNLVVGGQNAEGIDVTNELSYMCMQAEFNIRLPQPSFSIRYHSNSPDRFLRRAAELVKIGIGKPAMYNDLVIIPSLLNRGINIYDAREYGIVGCVEQSIPGKTYGGHGASKLNLAKCLEITLNNGIDPSTGLQLGPKTGEFLSFNSFDDLMKAFRKQIDYFVRQLVIMEHAITKAHAEMAPVPFTSLLVKNCINKGQDIMEGGAKYNFIGPEGIGVATTADSLAAIKKLVFEERKLKQDQLMDALKMNFSGNEIVRQMLLNLAPKYGNDEDYVDLIAREVVRIYCTEVEKYKTMRGGSFSPGMYPASAHVPMGMAVGATPDGRFASTPLNDGVSPAQGRDLKGPTASMKSVAKLDHYLVSNGTLLNMKFNPNNLRDDHSLQNFIHLIKTYFTLGGMHVQFNAICADTLRDAQCNPENYRDLVVRVAGYSAFFTALDKSLQDEIISRTEHAL
jgi:formate C-acetyltransferase